MELKQRYEQVVHEYTRQFCALFEYEYDALDWVADKVGGVFWIADLFFSFDEIKDTIDNSIPAGTVTNWHYHMIECVEQKKTYANLVSYHKLVSSRFKSE